MNLFIWIRIFVLTRVFLLFMLGSAWSLRAILPFWKLKTVEDYLIFFCVLILYSVGHVYFGSACTMYYYFSFELMYYYVASWTTLLFYFTMFFRCEILILFICVCDSICDSHMHINPINNLCFVLLKLTISVDFNGTNIRVVTVGIRA